VFQRTEVSDVLWQSSQAVNKHRGADLSANKAVIAIPFSECLAHLMPKAWLALADKTDNWTLQEGDVIVRGIVTDEVTTEFTMSDLRAKYDDVLEIVSAERMDQGSPNTHHWLIGCK
jgi:hypothetical protein